MGLIRGVRLGSIHVGGTNQARPLRMNTVQSPFSISWWVEQAEQHAVVSKPLGDPLLEPRVAVRRMPSEVG